MGSICLSSASILRCNTLLEIQSIALIIPTALEVIFSSSLLFLNWDGGKRHLLLTAEGWVYFILSAVELVFDIVPGARDNLSLFRSFDVGIGVASFLPIFFYTFFLFILTSNDLVETLPRRLKTVAKLSLILFVPAIIIFNEIASFVGVTIRNIPDPKNPTQAIVAVGFPSNREESLWAFFTSTTLALLVVFQAAVFCFAFFRLIRAVLAQRRIENEGSDKAHFVNGTGWLCASMKIGALESVVGFAGGAFGIAMTRRIMRMLARGCLCIGLVKGVDAVEDFHAVERELRQSKENDREAKRPLRKFMISNPRASTFRQLSPTAREFHATPNAKVPSIAYITEKSETPKHPHYLTWSQRRSVMLQTGLPGMKDFASIKEAREKQRVTILYNQGTPRLHLRFSTLDVLSPALIVEKGNSRPHSELLESYTKEQVPLHRGNKGQSFYSEKDSEELLAPAPLFHKDQPGTESSRDSRTSTPSFGAYEIIDARKMQQMTATAQTVNSSSVPNTTSALQFPEAIYQVEVPPIPLDERTSQDFNARVKSMASVKSVNDSIKAVRELTHQFPGPPGLSQIWPPENRDIPSRAGGQPFEIVEKSVWEEDSRLSAQRLSVLSTPQVIGSPSQLAFNKDRISQERSPSNDTDADVHLAYAGIDNVIADSPRARGGKVPITDGGYSRMSTISRNKGKRPSSQKPIDPFNDDEGSLQLSTSPVYAPVGVPLRQSLMPTAKAKPQPVTADVDTPTTVFSEITRLQETVVEMKNRIDPFLDFGTALDSGNSRQFRPSLPPMPQPAVPPQRRPSFIPTRARKLSKSEEKISRIVQWVDTSANVAMAEAQANPESIPITPLPVESPVEMLPSEKPRDNNLQNLHDRGPSIDALSIPWVKNTNISAEEKRRLGGPAIVESSALRPQLARITTVGKVPSRTTPTPMRSAHAHGISLHLQPIMVPPRNEKLPEVVQIEYGSLESPEGRNVLRDPEVLDIEDGLMPPTVLKST